MKTFKLTSTVILSISLLFFCACQNEPIDGDFQTENPSSETDCLSATEAYVAAVTNFTAWNGEDNAVYMPLCNNYASAIQSIIDNCGDPSGSFQAILSTLGDCTSIPDPETCEGVTNAVTIAENNFNNATAELYTQFCNVYISALQEQIEICGDANGEIQNTINGLGNCSSTNLTLLKKISYSQNPNNSIEFFYNTNNQLIKIQGADGSSKRWTYINGMVDRAQFYDASGNLSSDSEEKYIYVNGVMTERRDSYNLDTTPVLDEKYEYEFNSDGRLVESRYFGTNETEFSIKYTYTYNDEGNLTDYLKDYTNPMQSDVALSISNYDDKNYFMKNINPRIVLIDDFKNDSNNNPGDSSAYTYNSDDFPITFTNTNGDVTTYEYY